MNPTPPNSAPDAFGHPSVETVAEYLEDLLPPADAAQLGAHLADCADCAETLAALREVSALLEASPAPVLPDDVAVRIDAALAAQALLDAAPDPGPGPAAPKPLKTPGAADDASTAPGGPRGAAAPAGTAPGGARPPAGPGRGRSRGWRRAVLGLAALAVVGVIGTAIVQSGGGAVQTSGTAKSASGTGAQPPSAAVAAGIPSLGALTEAKLPQQLKPLLLPGTAGLHPQVQTGTANAPAASAGPADLPSCVLTAVGRTGQEPLGVGRGVYAGTPVFALVYTDPAHPQGPADAYLVDASCARGVLLRQTVARD
ncbi:anti-sigma factor family protein [Streptacidiphilus cavernicola]|uniref:Anti-sigma factor n=1 Tax=Streptacidiphilus cavernicola TaxID=3342716 RepID=A0ABV6VVL3_9ACTN